MKDEILNFKSTVGEFRTLCELCEKENGKNGIASLRSIKPLIDEIMGISCPISSIVEAGRVREFLYELGDESLDSVNLAYAIHFIKILLQTNLDGWHIKKFVSREFAGKCCLFMIPEHEDSKMTLVNHMNNSEMKVGYKEASLAINIVTKSCSSFLFGKKGLSSFFLKEVGRFVEIRDEIFSNDNYSEEYLNSLWAFLD